MRVGPCTVSHVEKVSLNRQEENIPKSSMESEQRTGTESEMISLFGFIKVPFTFELPNL